jgi:hypothetical protein
MQGNQNFVSRSNERKTQAIITTQIQAKTLISKYNYETKGALGIGRGQQTHRHSLKWIPGWIPARFPDTPFR